MISIPCSEQETVVSFSRDDERMMIYTSDSRMITKLHKLLRTDSKNRKPEYKLEKQEKCEGRVIAITVSAPVKLLSLRSHTLHREMSEEEKSLAADRLRKMREGKQKQ